MPGAVCVALPWIILYFGGLDLHLYVLVGFALIMMFLNRRELLVKSRTGEQPAVEGIEENRSVRKCPCCIVIEILSSAKGDADAAGGLVRPEYSAQVASINSAQEDQRLKKR